MNVSNVHADKGQSFQKNVCATEPHQHFTGQTLASCCNIQYWNMSFIGCNWISYAAQVCVSMCVCMHLDEDLPAQLEGWRKLFCVVIDRLSEQQISKHLLKVCGHVPLLDHTAVVLDGQDHGIPAEESRNISSVWWTWMKLWMNSKIMFFHLQTTTMKQLVFHSSFYWGNLYPQLSLHYDFEKWD